MVQFCPQCGKRLRLEEDYCLQCPSFDTPSDPQPCEYCGEEYATNTLEGERGVCDRCIVRLRVDPVTFLEIEDFKQILKEITGVNYLLGQVAAIWHTMGNCQEKSPRLGLEENNSPEEQYPITQDS